MGHAIVSDLVSAVVPPPEFPFNPTRGPFLGLSATDTYAVAVLENIQGVFQNLSRSFTSPRVR